MASTPEQERGLSGPPQPTLTRAAAIKELVGRANRGNQGALANLRLLLDTCPEIWQQAGDLAAIAERAWTELIAGTNQLLLESVKRRVAELKGDLAGEHPTPIEELLVDNIAASYLAAQHAEIQAASSGGSLEQAAFRLKRAESSQKRLLQATKTLATLRALVPRGLVPANHLKVFNPEQKQA